MIRAVEYYEIVCDYEDCNTRTIDLGGDYSAWNDPGEAEYEWTASSGCAIEMGGKTFHFCQEHSPGACQACDELDAEFIVDGDFYCEECRDEIQVSLVGSSR